MASGLVVGLIPAWRASRAALTPELAQQGKGIAGTSRMFARHALVVAQTALATMLLVGAALLLQSFVRLQQVRLGFEPDGVITARITLPRTSYPDAARTLGFWQRLLESLDGQGRRAERRDRHERAVHARRSRGWTCARSTDRLGARRTGRLARSSTS